MDMFVLQNVLSESDVVVLEGTGHTAVGSVVDLNNAQVNAVRMYNITSHTHSAAAAAVPADTDRAYCEAGKKRVFLKCLWGSFGVTFLLV